MDFGEITGSASLGMALIFLARIVDVSIGTTRIILIARGYRNIAPVLGFFEVLIWLSAVTHVINNLASPLHYIIFAGGFAAGNYTGMLIEEKLAIGYQSVRIITMKHVTALPLTLEQEGFQITTTEGLGPRGRSYVIYSVIKKRDVKRAVEIVSVLEPEAFITIEDVRSHRKGFIEEGRSVLNFFHRMMPKRR